VKDDRFFLLHIRDAVESIRAYTASGRAAFFADKRTQDADIRNLEIIGEATKRLTAATTSQRTEIPAVNYHFVKSLYLSDITAAQFKVERTFFRKSFLMALYTEFKALAVGGKSSQGILKIFSKSQHLEPGPDALEFVQAMSGQIAHRQFEPQWSGHTA
jgi:hypothetical protein